MVAHYLWNMLAVGVDVGATNLRVASGNDRGKILKRVEERTDKIHGPEGIGEQIIRLIRSLGLDVDNISGIGIGSLGPLDIKKGSILIGPNLPFNNVPLKEPLENVFQCPIRVLNDASSAVLGEKLFGAGKGTDNLCYVTISSGIGCGAVVDGKLLSGKDGNAHEMGHTVIDMEARLRCGCGRWGHWEAYCSGNNLHNYVRLWVEQNHEEDNLRISRLSELSQGRIDKLSAKTVFDCASQGDELSARILEDVGRLNAIGFANIISAYDPQLITVGGSVTLNNEDQVIVPIKKHLSKFSVNRPPEIKVTELGSDAGLYGALAMSFTDY
jgi:glucokinase